VTKRTGCFLAAGAGALLAGAAVVLAVGLLLRGGAPPLARWSGPGYLSLEIEGELPERPASEWESFLESPRPSLHALIESLDRAADDPDIRGLLVRVAALPEAGWGRVQELREALLRFRESGKPCWAHLEFAGNKEYFLATGCSKLAASPTALLFLQGLAAEVTFFRGTLDKLGIEAQFEGVGRYKNAPNQLTERGLTPPHREQMEALVDHLYAEYVKGVAEGRGLDETRVRALLEEGPFVAEAAREAGLVDELLYRDQVEVRVGGAPRVRPGSYLRARRGLGLNGRPRLALVRAVGDIVHGESGTGPLGDGTVGADTLIRGIREAGRDQSVRAIVLRVDSPGGVGSASDAVWRELGIARRRKPVVVSMGDVAASGGYYIAMNADVIVAQPTTITGSIGVFSGKFSLRALYEKLGLTRGVVSRGGNAMLLSSWEPWTEEERRRIRRLNQAFYETFITKAAEGRGRTPEEIDAVAQGRVWTGTEAVDAGLVDRLGGLHTAVALAKEKAGIPASEEVQLVSLPEEKGLFELLRERREEDVGLRLLGPEARALLRLAAVFGDQGPLARMPFELRVR
jgi:protease-4